MAATALLATLRSSAAPRLLVGVLAGALVVLIVAFALPLAPPSAFGVGLGGSSAPPVNSIAIVEVGVTPDVTSTQEKLILWAQVENTGPPLGGTRVVFTVVTREGNPAWSVWYEDVSWLQGERKRPEVAWDTKAVQGGDYRLEVRVESRDPGVVYSRADNASLVSIHP